MALDYSERKKKGQLSSLLGVQGIPFFVVFDKDGSIITKDGRAAVSSDPTGAEFPWYPKPVSNLSGGPGSINEVTTVLAFCETSDAATQSAIYEAMRPLAEKYKAEAKAAGEDEPAVGFMMVTKNEGLAPRIRGMLKLDGLPPAKHEHPLEKSDKDSSWGCDGCGQSGAGKERWRCAQGCDFDFCGECNEKANAGGAKSLAPKLMILDIPDQGGYYEGPEGEITADSVKKLVDDYSAKSLERKQLE